MPGPDFGCLLQRRGGIAKVSFLFVIPFSCWSLVSGQANVRITEMHELVSRCPFNLSRLSKVGRNEREREREISLDYRFWVEGGKREAKEQRWKEREKEELME